MSIEIKNNLFKKQNLLGAGFEKEVNRIEMDLCPFCGNPIKLEDFRDALSLKELKISGLCQNCQDQMFGK